MSNIHIRLADWQQDNAELRRIRESVFITEQAVPPELEWDAEDAAAVASALHRRDAADSQVVDFLSAADGVTVVDSTDLDFAQTVAAVLDVVAAEMNTPTQETNDGR